MTKTLRRALIACLATLCLLAALLGGGMMFMRASAADGDIPAATTVPEDELEQLSMENGVAGKAVASSSSAPNNVATIRYTPTADSGDDYTLADATDIAIRLKVVNRQTNRPNGGNGLCYVRIKFVGSDTIWGVTKEDLRFTFLDATTNTVGTLRVSNGGNNNVGGQMNVPVRTDGTVYFPLTQIRDGNQTAELGNRLSETANYQDLAIEYIEFSASSSRWDFAIGEIALVRQANNAVTTDVLDFTANEQHNVVMYNTWYDNVKLVVNGTEATQTADGAYEADLGAMGKVRIPSDKVFAYDPVMVSSDLAEGYGITAVATSAEGKEIQQRGEEADNLTSSAYNKDRSALLAGYTYEGEYFLRKGNHGLYPGGSDDTATLGTDPLNATINVTVSPLVALDITGEADGVDIYYFRLGTLAKYDCVVANNNYTDMPDDGSDGTLWLKPDEAAAVLVIPKAGYDFTGVRLDGTELTSEEERADAETNRVSMAVYMITVGENATLEVLGLGDEVGLTLDLPAEGGSVSIDGTAVTGTTYQSNVYKTLSINASPEKGYASAVSIVYPAAEEGGEERTVELEAATDGNYYYRVDGTFSIEVTFEIVTYQLTYRLNNGQYAAGESNPATITYFDTVTLKNPVREGYDFVGWRIEGEEGTVTELKEVESDLTLIAVFEMADTPVDPDPGDDPGDQPGGDNGGDNGGGCGGTLAGALGLGAAAAVIMIATVAVILKKKKN